MSLVVTSEVNFDLLMLVSYTTLYLKVKVSVSELNLDTQVTKSEIKKDLYSQACKPFIGLAPKFCLEKSEIPSRTKCCTVAYFINLIFVPSKKMSKCDLRNI